MHADPHAGRTVVDDRVDEVGVLIEQLVEILPTLLGDLPDSRVTGDRETDLVQLQIVAADGGEIGEFLLVDRGDIVEIFSAAVISLADVLVA